MALSTTQYGYIIDPMVPFTDDKGKTIKNGFVRVFVAGSSTPVVTYRNFDGATNQDLIELDNSGRTKTSVIGSKGFTYKVCVYDKHHSQESPILTVDKVSVIGANITAGAGSTVVTGLDGLTTKPDGFVDASVVGTDGYVALDHTLVTDDLDTDAKVTAVENDRYIPLLNEDVNDPDSKITLGRLWQWVLGKIKSLSTSITAFRTGDVLPVDGPSGTAKMSKDDLLRVTAENVGNDLDASATSALLPYGKTFPLKKSDLIGLKFGYVDSDGTIRSSDTHKYCEIPLHCVKEISVSLPGGGFSYLYAVVVKDETGSYAGYIPLSSSGVQTISISPQLGGTLYLNFFNSLGDATFSVKYYGLDEMDIQNSKLPYELKNYLDVSLLNSYQPYGKTISITKNDLKGLKFGYVDSDGTIRSSDTHKYCEIPLCGVKNVKVTLPGGGFSYLYAIVMKKSDGSFVYGGSLDVSTEQVVSVSPQIGGTLYLNFFYSQGNITFYVEHYRADEVFGVPASKADFESLIMPSRIAYGRKITIVPALAEGFENGVVMDDGTLSTGHGRKHVTISMRCVKSIKIKNAAGGSVSGFSHVVLEFPNSQYRAYCPAANSGDLTSGKIMLDWLGKIHLNYYSQSASIGATWEIEYFSEEEMQTHDDQKRRLVNLVRKPLNLGSSDKAMFAGSSVMKGFTSGSTTTNYNLPYWVNEKFNFSSYVNVAVGGSTIANVAGYVQLISQLSGLDTSYTLLVMYAGQNDYALGVNATDFRNAVKDLCDYINANASNTCKVVFITPIDDGGYHMYENTRYTANDEDDYRYIIQEEMMKNDTYARFNIVQGRDFGFPSMASSASAISTFFGDRLHPTELGYKTLMANGFLNAIG